jgi:hypothetical protein
VQTFRRKEEVIVWPQHIPSNSFAPHCRITNRPSQAKARDDGKGTKAARTA